MANVTKDLGPVSAYALAVLHGYTGTEDEWAALQASSAQNAQSAAESAAAAAESAQIAAFASSNAGESKDAAAASAAAAAASAAAAETKNFEIDTAKLSDDVVNEMQKRIGSNPSQEPALVTFVTDDARTQDYTLFAPLFAQYGLPCTTAVVTNLVDVNEERCTKAQLLELQNTYGWEVCSHGSNHVDLTGLSDEELDANLSSSRKWLIDNGFNGYEALMIPYGLYDERVCRHIAKFYKMSRTTNEGPTTYPITSFTVTGYYINNSETVTDITGYARNDAEHYKALIDQTIAAPKWLIIWMHSWEIDSWGLSDMLSDVLAYAKEKQDAGEIQVVTCKEALGLIGNTVDQAWRGSEFDDHFVVAGNGVVSSNIAKTVVLQPNSVSFSTPPFDFKHNHISVVNITSAGDAANSPTGKNGTLITHCFAPKYTEVSNSAYVWQEFWPLGQDFAYTRIASYSNTWYGTPRWRLNCIPVVTSDVRLGSLIRKYAGCTVYDSTLKKLVSYNGSAWMDMQGNAVD